MEEGEGSSEVVGVNETVQRVDSEASDETEHQGMACNAWTQTSDRCVAWGTSYIDSENEELLSSTLEVR